MRETRDARAASLFHGQARQSDRDEQDFLDFDGDGESDPGEQWSVLKVFQECDEEYARRETCEVGAKYGINTDDHASEDAFEEAPTG